MAVSNQWSMTKEERTAQNNKLKEYGYVWIKYGDNGRWKLVDTQNNNAEVQVGLAMAMIDSGKRTKPAPVHNYIDRAAAIAWAQGIVNRKQTDPQVIYLDTETTGTGKDDVVIQIGVKNPRGETLMDTLVNPNGVPIHEEATKTHGYTNAMLEDCPSFEDVWFQLEPLLHGTTVIIYNASFDVRLLEQSAKPYDLVLPKFTTHCLMREYARFHGLVKQGINELVFVPQKLESACEYFGITPGGHSALGDAEASRQVLLAMAKEEV